jgi:hypothetical protein
MPELVEGEHLDGCANVLLVGPGGTDKSHLAIALTTRDVCRNRDVPTFPAKCVA